MYKLESCTINPKSEYHHVHVMSSTKCLLTNPLDYVIMEMRGHRNTAPAEKEIHTQMIIEEKVYQLPTADAHNLKVIEVTDLGEVPTSYGLKKKLSIKILVTDEKADDGSDIYVFINAGHSIGAKSTLGKFLRSLGISTVGQVDLDELIGFKFRAVIEHNKSETNGKTYANVGSILRGKTPQADVI